MSHEPTNTDPTAGPPADPAALEEILVAYLDRELDDEDHCRVEQLLATDPKVRETLKRLDRTWELLDELDPSPVEETFTQTTLEMVTLAAAHDVSKQEEAGPRRRRRRWLIGTAGLLAAGLAGFGALALLWPNPNEPLLRDLPVLENLDEYRQIDDADGRAVEFLRMLDREKVFAEEVSHES